MSRVGRRPPLGVDGTIRYSRLDKDAFVFSIMAGEAVGETNA